MSSILNRGFAAACFCCCLATWSGLCAQHEAQGGEEYLEFQRVYDPPRTVRIEVGDRVRYDSEGERGRGRVTAWTDSSLVVAHPRSGVSGIVDLEAGPVIKRVNRLRLWLGAGLAALGAAFVGLSTAFYIGLLVEVGASILSNLPYLLAGFLFNPFVLLTLGLGIWLMASAVKRARPGRWMWRRVRSIFERKPG